LSVSFVNLLLIAVMYIIKPSNWN